MRILAIETSCDDTGIAILEINPDGQPRLLADLVSSQTKIHAPWGGVVPTLAKREHQKNLVPLLEKALNENKLLKKILPLRGISRREKNSPPAGDLPKGEKFKIQNYNAKFKILNKILEREPELLKKLPPFLEKYQKPDIDLIAVTVGPGLEPALWVGVNFARALAFFWNLPVIPVNHIEAHIAANFFQSEKISGKSKLSPYGRSPEGRQIITLREISRRETNYHPPSDHPQGGKLLLPAVCLVVSGGHTQLILMKKFGQYEIIGETRDDAAGEAFDKVAKMLNLGYPGGPAIAKLASQWNFQFPISNFQKNPKTQNPKKALKQIKYKLQNTNYSIKLPRPMINSKDYDFSFSGLKTAALYLVKKLNAKQLKKLTPAIAAEFQQAVIDVLVAKTIQAAREFKAKTVLLSGGVAANDALRENLKLETKNLKLNFLVPPKSFCTDNAAMIGLTAYHRIGPEKSRRKNSNWRNIKADANLTIA